jgi:Lrp/AsnC family leucine-responsive transcriptional regulator
MIAFDYEKLLDATGWELLRALQEDARLSFSELGRRVGLTPPAVAERVHRLEEAGIITGYHAQVNPEKVGFSLTAFIRLGSACEHWDQVSALAQALPEILECHRIIGDDCFIIKVAVSSVPHLDALIKRLAVYGRTTTSIVLSSPVCRRVIEEHAACVARERQAAD